MHACARACGLQLDAHLLVEDRSWWPQIATQLELDLLERMRRLTPPGTRDIATALSELAAAAVPGLIIGEVAGGAAWLAARARFVDDRDVWACRRDRLSTPTDWRSADPKRQAHRVRRSQRDHRRAASGHASRDYWAQWGSINCPTIVVRGQHGNLTPEHTRQLAHSLAHGETATMTNAGHGPAPREPGRVAARVEAVPRAPTNGLITSSRPSTDPKIGWARQRGNLRSRAHHFRSAIAFAKRAGAGCRLIQTSPMQWPARRRRRERSDRQR
jgi:hypothetical protein